MSRNENLDEYNTTDNEELLGSIDVQYAVLTPVVIAASEDCYAIYEMPASSDRCSSVDNSLMPIDQNENAEMRTKMDPFSPECRIPIPGESNDFMMYDNKTFVRRRNERERTRVRNVNDGFERLRQHLPLGSGCQDKRSSKVETLRLAIRYIRHLEELLKNGDEK